METEYEATFTNINKEDIRNRLRSISADQEHSEFLQKRFTFNLPEGHGSTDEWIRVRKEAKGVSVAYKSVTGGDIEGQQEIEFMANDMNKAAEFLSAIGAEKKAYQENKRELWIIDDVEITLDEWPFLEPFVEIEGPSESEVKNVAEKLNFDWAEAKFCAITELYAQKYDISNNYINNEISKITFDIDNPFTP